MNAVLRRTFAAVAGGALALSAFADQAQAQAFPSRPITLVVPFAPGASADGIARIVGRELSLALGQAVVVDNTPGGGGATGLILVSKAAPDGYTIGMGATGAIAVNPHLPDAAPLNPQQQLTPIAKVADIPLVFVAGAKAGYANLPTFLDKAKGGDASTGTGISSGTTGQYTAQHLAGELLASMSKVKMVAVPYRGSGPAVTDLLGGQLPVAVVDLTSAYPHVKSGALVALGVTSPTRSTVAPEIPTLAEGGVPGYSATAWMGIFAPAKVPPAIVDKLTSAIRSVLAKPEVQSQIVSLAAEPKYLAPAEFGRFIQGETNKWGRVISSIPAPQK
jgi:tripartite-type tricarboxylate transporter receptor subunit TctC